MTDMILIYDDEPGRVADWRERLRSIPEVKQSFEVQGVGDKEFIASFEELKARRVRSRNASSSVSGGDVAFDAASILVIDYDLLRIEHAGYLTGEAVAYLARCYSGCGIIVGLNQYGDNIFDLTLRGHPESYADLNIGGSQLHNRGLWLEPWSTFRPWQWPLLTAALEGLRSRIKSIEGRLDTSIVEHMQLSDNVVRTLPRAARDFVTKKSPVQEATFRAFALDSAQGFKSRDKSPSDVQTARVAAARLAQWVEGFLLPGQDILVDAPHLVYRYPSLLDGAATNIDAWNQTAQLGGPKQSGVRHELIDRFALPREWASRPVWSWIDVSTSESIKEVKEPWSIRRPEWVFCEDLSRFLPQDAAREFVANVESPFARRHISNPQAEQVAHLRDELLAVEYRPQERLYL